MKKKGLFILLIFFVLSSSNFGFGQTEEEGEQLCHKGGEAYENGKYQEALFYYEEALKLLNTPVRIAATLNSLGAAYYNLGQYSKSISSAEEALKIFRRLDFSEGIASTLRNIADAYLALGLQDKALSYYEEALMIYRRLNIPERILKVLHNIADSYGLQDQYSKALPYDEEALKISRELGISQYIASDLIKVGEDYQFLGQYDKVLLHYEEAIGIYKKLRSLPGISSTLNKIGSFYYHVGQYNKALVSFEEALKIKKELNVPQESAEISTNIGTVYYSLNRYEKALLYFEDAIKIFEEMNMPESVAFVLRNIALIHYSLGQYEEALSCNEEVLKMNKELKNPMQTAITLNNIAGIYVVLGWYEKALIYLEEALKIKKEIGLPLSVALTLDNIGCVFLLQKRYKEAGEKFLEATGEYRKIGTKIFIDPWVELNIATGEYDKASLLLEEVKPNWNTSDSGKVHFFTQNGLILEGKGLFKEASVELLKGVSLSEEIRQRARERTGFFHTGLFGSYIRTYRALVSSLAERFLRGEKSDPQFSAYGNDLASSALYFAESTKARTLLEAMVTSPQRYKKEELPSDLRKREEDVLTQLSVIENIWEETYKKNEKGFEELVKRKESLKKQRDALISQMRKDYPRYAALNYPIPFSPEELPLKDDEVILEYAFCDNATYLFKTKKGGVEKIIRIPKTKEEIENLVTEFCQPFNRNPDTGIIPYKDFSIQKGKALYKILLANALKEISEETNIIIVPDGILGVLPFEALVITEGENLEDTVFVADKWKLTYYQSATVLALNRLLQPSKAQKILFALGNPIYSEDDPRYVAYKQGKPIPTLFPTDTAKYAYRGLATHHRWGKTTKEDKGCEVTYPPLQETEDEVRKIASIFNVKPELPDILLNIFASETNLKSNTLNNYHYLHFATHADLPGKVQGKNEPFIVLGQVENEKRDDGFLTLTEVLDMSLDADMVVLSACLTGRGNVMEGEGLVNFARAFHYAGARTVLVSLWEIASKETVEYMQLFYQCLKEGKSKIDAFAIARKEIKRKYPSPFFWAAFILHGEG